MCSENDSPPYERPVPKVTKPAIHRVSSAPAEPVAVLLERLERQALSDPHFGTDDYRDGFLAAVHRLQRAFE